MCQPSGSFAAAMLVYAAADLLFATRIGHAARDAGLTARPVRNLPMLTMRLDQVDDGRPAGPVRAVWVDLEHPDAAALLTAAGAHPAAPAARLAFGPHVNVAALAAARATGAETLARGRFTAELPARCRALAVEAAAANGTAPPPSPPSPAPGSDVAPGP